MCCKKKYILTFLSALLSSLPFTFPSLFFLPLVCPSIFFFLLDREEGFKTAFRLSFVFSVTYYLGVHYYFLALYPLDFAGLSNFASLGVVLVGWIGISLFQGLELTLFLTLYKKLVRNRNLFSPFVLASLFALCEFIQSLGTLGFPWGSISLTQYKFLPFIQSVSLFGATFLTFLIILINALLSVFFDTRKKAPLIVTLALFSLNTLFGTIRVSFDVKDTVDVTVVQPSILSGEKWNGTSSLDVLLDLSEKSGTQDVIVWPETAVNSNLLESKEKCEKIYNLLERKNASLITGAFYEEGESVYNSAVLFDSTDVQLYHKRHLVPFGEYVPARAFVRTVLPFLSDINMLSSDLTAGESAAVFNSSYGNIGTLVCFDSIFTNLAVNSVKNGAELLCIITNDSWYKRSTALYHHNAQAVFRAVENNRFVVRCANSGVSSFIDPLGRIIYMSQPDERTTHTEKVGLIEEKTLYTKTGNVFPYFALVLVIIYPLKKKADA